MYKQKINLKNRKKYTYSRTFLLLLTFMFTFGTYGFAEKKTGVSGQIKDAKTKKVIEFCTVRVFNLKDSLVSGATTDDNGFFYIPLNRGKYKFLAEYIGYKTDTVEVTVKTGNEFIGIMKLNPVETSIDEVTITGKSKENLLDKDEYIVTGKLKTGAANTKDVLSKVDGVTYDRYNNTIKVDNEDNIIILVNGLEKDQEYIQNLAPERLKKIEIIRDPSGRYALEGYSAVINIILKDDYKGFEFYTEDQVFFDTDTKNKQYFPINRLTTSLNYTYNKINIYGKFNNHILNLEIPGESVKEFDDGLSIIKTPGNNSENLILDRMYNRVTLGLDYFVNPKHTISFESRIGGNFFKNNIEKSMFSVSEFQNNTQIDNYNTENYNTSTNSENSSSVYYKGIINKGNTLNMDFTYSDSKNEYSNDYYQNGDLIYNQSGINDNTNTKFYAEINHTMNSKSGIQAGYGNTWKKVINTFDFGETKFTQTEIRHKLYAYYSLNINKKFGIKTGIAAEVSTPEIEGKKRTYFIYQPYADIKINPLQTLDIRLKYRSSSDYPSVNEANPDTIFIDNTALQVGNPNLAPSVTHKLSVRFNIMKGLASVEPYYHFSNNYITQTGKLNNNGIFEYTYNNAGQYKHYGFKVGLTVPFGKSLFWQNNADFFRSSILYNDELNSIKDWTMSSNLIYVNKKHKTTTGIIYQNNLKKHITAQGYNMWNNDFWGYMIQQPLFKERINIMAFYMLPVNFGIEYNQGSYIHTDGYTQTDTQNLSILKNIILFRISVRLNKGKSILKNEKKAKEENDNNKGGFFN